MKRRVPPRLFVLLAAQAPAALILRRGPSAWCHLLAWDTAHDRFEHGAWIRGRVYAEMCDLSPDGSLFVYSVHKGGRAGTPYTDCWTGVSRSPWMHALGLWPVGTTYGGGGRFDADGTVVLRLGECCPPHPDHPAIGLKVRHGYAPEHASAGLVEGAQWSGRDQRGDIVFARGGCLYRHTERGDRVLIDLNDLRPDPQPAPAWALRPCWPHDNRGRWPRRAVARP